MTTFPKLVAFKSRSHDIGKFFGSMPPWVLFVLIVACSVLIAGAGFLFGHQRFLRGVEEPVGPLETAVSSVFGLLAFMLGFTFSLTWSRFAKRNSILISQSKTLLDCYLRTSLLPEKQKEESRKFLYEYATILFRMQTTLTIEGSLTRIEELHLLLWQETASLVNEDIDSEIRSQFTSSINKLISVAMERKTVALIFRIPDAIWSSLLLLAAMGMIGFGYYAGISGMHRLFQLPLLPIAFGLVIVLIADLNSSDAQRHFKVTYKPLRDVLDIMEKGIP